MGSTAVDLCGVTLEPEAVTRFGQELERLIAAHQRVQIMGMSVTIEGIRVTVRRPDVRIEDTFHDADGDD